MQVKSTTKSLHPGRWQPATWILLAVWLTASAFGNFPFGPMGVGGNETTIVHIGFPLWYTEHQYDPSTGFVLTTTDGKYLFANLFLGVAIQLSLILGLQSFQQFSMKTMLLVVSLLAALLGIGKALDGLHVVYLIIGIYLLPLPFAAVMIVHRCATRIRNATELADARATSA